LDDIPILLNPNFKAPCLPAGRKIQNKHKIQILKLYVLNLGFGIYFESWILTFEINAY